MTRKMVRTFNLCAVCFIVLVVAVLQMPATANSGVHMAPSTIVMNVPVKGQFQDVQAIIGGSLGGCWITEFEIWLHIEGVSDPIAADYVRYCYVDDNYLMTFDRAAIQAAVQGAIDSGEVTLIEDCRCQELKVTVSGSVWADCTDGTEKEVEFHVDGSIEVFDPDWRP